MFLLYIVEYALFVFFSRFQRLTVIESGFGLLIGVQEVQKLFHLPSETLWK